MSPRKLKVYRWQACPVIPADHPIRSDPGWESHYAQVEMIVAARSQAEAARLGGYDRASQMFNLGETGNALSIETALAEPGTLFIKHMGGGRDGFHRYERPSWHDVGEEVG